MNNTETIMPRAEVYTSVKDVDMCEASIAYYCPNCGAKIKPNQQYCKNIINKCVCCLDCIPYERFGEIACNRLEGLCGDGVIEECGTKFDWTKRATIELNPKITWEARYQTPYNETNYTDRIKSLYVKQQTTKSEE